MTVEASLVMTVVLMVYLFVIRCMFFQYDRCILEQDAARLVVQCVSGSINDSRELERLTEQFRDEEQYLWLDVQEPDVQRKGGFLSVQVQGINDQIKNCEAGYKVWQTDPVGVLRAQRAIKGKLKEGEEKGK